MQVAYKIITLFLVGSHHTIFLILPENNVKIHLPENKIEFGEVVFLYSI